MIARETTALLDCFTKMTHIVINLYIADQIIYEIIGEFIDEMT